MLISTDNFHAYLLPENQQITIKVTFAASGQLFRAHNGIG
jgi:hypothetical protein